MQSETAHKWRHDHSFGQERTRVGERRTFIVTAVTMVVEIVSGLAFGSMALFAAVMASTTTISRPPTCTPGRSVPTSTSR